MAISNKITALITDADRLVLKALEAEENGLKLTRECPRCLNRWSAKALICGHCKLRYGRQYATREIK